MPPRATYRQVFAVREFRVLWSSVILSTAGDRLALVLTLPDGGQKSVEVAAGLGVRYLPRLPVPRKGIADAVDVSWTKLDGPIGLIYVRRIRQGLERSLDTALRGLGDYKYRERYSTVEFARAFAGLGVTRPVLEGLGPGGPYHYHGHKGFDYRVVAGELAAHFSIARRLYSPMPALGAFLNSQAWFVCRPR